MRTALYTRIEPAAGRTVAWTIREAQRRCRITLVQFAGWTNADLRSPDGPGPRKQDAASNRALLNEILDALTEPDGDCPTIDQCAAEPRRRVMEDEEGLALVHQLEPGTADADI